MQLGRGRDYQATRTSAKQRKLTRVRRWTRDICVQQGPTQRSQHSMCRKIWVLVVKLLFGQVRHTRGEIPPNVEIGYTLSVYHSSAHKSSNRVHDTTGTSPGRGDTHQRRPNNNPMDKTKPIHTVQRLSRIPVRIVSFSTHTEATPAVRSSWMDRIPYTLRMKPAHQNSAAKPIALHTFIFTPSHFKSGNPQHGKLDRTGSQRGRLCAMHPSDAADSDSIVRGLYQEPTC